MMMIVSDLTDEQLQAAGYLIAEARARLAEQSAGVDPWDRAGVVGQLRTALAGLTVGDALTIALTAAGDPQAATPAAFSWSQYRRPAAAPLDRKATRGPTCRICTRTEYACQKAQENTGTDWHAFEPGEP